MTIRAVTLLTRLSSVDQSPRAAISVCVGPIAEQIGGLWSSGRSMSDVRLKRYESLFMYHGYGVLWISADLHRSDISALIQIGAGPKQGRFRDRRASGTGQHVGDESVVPTVPQRDKCSVYYKRTPFAV